MNPDYKEASDRIWNTLPTKAANLFPSHPFNEAVSYRKLIYSQYSRINILRDIDHPSYRFWCEEKFKNDWLWTTTSEYTIYFFKNEEDAMLFKLTFPV